MLDTRTNALPDPSEEEKQRSLLLKEKIRQSCNTQSGRIRFSEYMNLALYEPGLGYYSSGSQKFGEKGDFITSPEVSPLFGQCLANQLGEIFGHLNSIGGSTASIMEFGAGSGLLVVDVLSQLETMDSLPEKYFILELSAELRERQRRTIVEKIPHLLEYVQWLDRLPGKMDKVVVLANEVLDAMPVEIFKFDRQVKGDGHLENVCSLTVAENAGELVHDYEPASDDLIKKIDTIKKRSEIVFSDGYQSEYNPAITGWLAALESRIDNLVILLIDYGYNEKEYYHPERSGGTLMCYYQHRAHDDFFWWPGLQDITAFVNFTDVAYSAVDLGLSVSGYTTQAAFLLANGLSDLHAEQVTQDVQQQIRLSQQIKTLTLPSEMGERFKVMALTKNYEEPLSGFSMLDLRGQL